MRCGIAFEMTVFGKIRKEPFDSSDKIPANIRVTVLVYRNRRCRVRTVNKRGTVFLAALFDSLEKLVSDRNDLFSSRPELKFVNHTASLVS